MKPLGRVWLLTAAYALVAFALGVDRFVIYRSGSDLGLFTQAISTVFHGFHDTPENGSHFTYHFSPIFYLCAPLLLLTRSPLALTFTQAVVSALALPPLYLIARKRLPEGLAFGVTVIAALYPPMWGTTFTDFHENAFAPAAILWMLWALDNRRLGWALLALVVALCIKEDQAAILTFAGLLGCAYFAWKRDRRLAIFSFGGALLAAFTFGFYFTVVRTLAGAHDVWSPTHFYTWSRIVDPRGSAPITSIGRPAYFLEAMLPLAFGALLSPAFVFALPGFVEVLGSHESITYTMGTHYAAVWVPWVLWSFALGVAGLYARRPGFARGLVRTSLVLCVLILAFASPTHWGHYLGPRTAHDAVLDEAVRRVGTTLDVGTFDELYAHVGFDPNAQLGLDLSPRYVLVDSTYERSWFTVRYLPQLQAAVRNGSARLVWSQDGVMLFDRGGSARTSAEPPARARGRRSVAALARAGFGRAIDRGRRNE